MNEIQASYNINAQLRAEYENGISMYKQIAIPEPIYNGVRFTFDSQDIKDWYLDKNGDIVIWLYHRGETIFEYSPVLETQLETIFST